MILPVSASAQTSIPRTEEEAFARYLYDRALEAQISPIRLITVSMCESGLRVSTPPNTNKNGSLDKGLMRINSIHASEMAKMGLRWGKYEDDVAYALSLIKTNGWWDYRFSRDCWTNPMKIQKAYELLALSNP